MDPGVFYEVIVPLMEVRGTATICISTPVGSWNFYTELSEVPDGKGGLLFNVIKVGMVCERCKGTELEDQCEHPTGDRPDWKPDDTYEKVKAIYGNRRTLLQREIRGQVADDQNLAFEVRHLKAFYARPPIAEPHATVDEVFVAVDPNGGASGDGGTGSESAVVSFYFSGANVVVSVYSLVLLLLERQYHLSKIVSTDGIDGIRRQHSSVQSVEFGGEPVHRQRRAVEQVEVHW